MKIKSRNTLRFFRVTNAELTFWRTGELTLGLLAAYVIVQMCGGVIGMCVTHVMFDLPVI